MYRNMKMWLCECDKWFLNDSKLSHYNDYDINFERWGYVTCIVCIDYINNSLFTMIIDSTTTAPAATTTIAMILSARFAASFAFDEIKNARIWSSVCLSFAFLTFANIFLSFFEFQISDGNSSSSTWRNII